MSLGIAVGKVIFGIGAWVWVEILSICWVSSSLCHVQKGAKIGDKARVDAVIVQVRVRGETKTL